MLRPLLASAFIGGFLLACSGGGSSGSGNGGASGNTTSCSCSAGAEECCVVTLSPSASETTVTIPFVSPGRGNQKYTGVRIDASAFTSGGTLVIRGAAGSGPYVSIDVFEASATFPTQGEPSGTLASCYNNAGPAAFTFGHAFTEPSTFKLGATGAWESPAGMTNTVTLTLSVTSGAPPEKTCDVGGSPGGGSEECDGCTADSDCGSCQRCQRSTCTCVARLSC